MGGQRDEPGKKLIQREQDLGAGVESKEGEKGIEVARLED
jgi:hypothetical protein